MNFHYYKGKFVLGLVLYLPGVVIFTPVYIIFVVLTSIYNFIWPEWIQDENKEKTFITFKVKYVLRLFSASVQKVSGKDANSYLVMLRMAEVLMEACPQAALGNFSKTDIWEGNLLSNVNICQWFGLFLQGYSDRSWRARAIT